MVDEDNCVFFLPHRPRGEICEPPIFLFMKGTGVYQIANLAVAFCKSSNASILMQTVKILLAAWCGAGADHYEPLIATVLQHGTPDKAAVVL